VSTDIPDAWSRIANDPEAQRLAADMERAGYQGQLDLWPGGAFRVRVKARDKALRYNVHTTSTGGMGNAIRAAYAKWRDGIHVGRIPDFTDGGTS